MAAPTDPFLLFVYGTLMSDGCRAAVLAGQRCLGRQQTRPHYRLLDLGAYPGLTREHTGTAIEGELYEVESALGVRLDRIEGASALFRLEAVELEGIAGPVWAYFYQRGGPETPVYSGRRWHNRGDSREADGDDD